MRQWAVGKKGKKVGEWGKEIDGKKFDLDKCQQIEYE